MARIGAQLSAFELRLVDALANQAVGASADILAGLGAESRESLDSRKQARADNALSTLHTLQAQEARVAALLDQVAGSW